MEWNHKQEPFWDEYFQDLSCTLWGRKAIYSLSYYNNGQNCRDPLDRFAVAAEQCLQWLNTHQAEVFAAIEADGLYNDALEWLDHPETVEEDGVSYVLLYDVGRVPLPYRKEDFFSSLALDGLSFSADSKSTEFIADMFLCTEPDVFAGHSIEIFLNGDFGSHTAAYTLKVNGLAG